MGRGWTMGKGAGTKGNFVLGWLSLFRWSPCDTWAGLVETSGEDVLARLLLLKQQGLACLASPAPIGPARHLSSPLWTFAQAMHPISEQPSPLFCLALPIPNHLFLQLCFSSGHGWAPVGTGASHMGMLV